MRRPERKAVTNAVHVIGYTHRANSLVELLNTVGVPTAQTRYPLSIWQGLRAAPCLVGYAKRHSQLLLISGTNPICALAVSVAARLLTVPVVFDAFIPLEEKYNTPGSPRSGSRVRSWILQVLDYGLCRAPCAVLTDTEEHAVLLTEQTGTDRGRFASILPYPPTQMNTVSAVMARPVAGPEIGNVPLVLWVGGNSDLHGLQLIEEAIEIVAVESKAIAHFTLIYPEGDGRSVTFRSGLTVKRLSYQSIEIVRDLNAEARIALGIFSEWDKGDRVIPYKVLDAMAAGAAVITRESHAMRRVFQPDLHFIQVQTGSARSLSAALLALLGDPERVRSIGQAGQERWNQACSAAVLGAELAKWLETFGLGSSTNGWGSR